MKKVKRVVGLVVVAMMEVGAAKAGSIVLEGIDSETTTTGDLVDEAGYSGLTTNVVEIPGLKITVRAGEDDQKINVTGDSLGVTVYGSGDETDAFEIGESMVLSFNNRVRIDRIDFNRMKSGETFSIAIGGGEPLEIAYDGLNDKRSGYYDAGFVVPADVEIEFSLASGNAVGLDGLVVEALPSVSMIRSNETASIGINLAGVTPASHVLEHSADLSDSNGWNAVSAPFSASTNWPLETANAAGFYRVVPE